MKWCGDGESDVELIGVKDVVYVRQIVDTSMAVRQVPRRKLVKCDWSDASAWWRRWFRFFTLVVVAVVVVVVVVDDLLVVVLS